MNILGIDTSCDDTSAAVVTHGSSVLSNVTNSQIKLHNPYGGVVPELASREHIRNIVPVVDEALSRAGMSLKELDAIAVTIGPGLIGSLLVGLYYAKTLSYFNKIPLVDVNHLEGHILSILLEDDHPQFPFAALTVSGGHTSIYYVKAPGDYEQLGQTLDDAAGEAFDKVAKILGLGYPGGTIIESMSRSGRADSITFPRAYMSDESFDFSFSGLKTAVSLYIGKWERKDCAEHEHISVEDITASFQEAVFEVLINKLIKAGRKKKVSSLVLAGGVACNMTLREKLTERAADKGMKVFYPRPEFCTDNGAMIALAGHYRAVNHEYANMSIDVRSRYPLKDIRPVNK
ncbi:MAG: tRNA (adenosine(37)-N6)-threonylcarbamoyltransferase complex transferase subunit TsaD [Desulfobacteraceae bacterium]|jgi:N6-L-threonylcarbamoyladenine synthase